MQIQQKEKYRELVSQFSDRDKCCVPNTDVNGQRRHVASVDVIINKKNLQCVHDKVRNAPPEMYVHCRG